MTRFAFPGVLALGLVISLVRVGEAYTIDDYNASLVDYGVPFYTQYPASFYTGFAPRIEDPNRIHFRAGRGIQFSRTRSGTLCGRDSQQRISAGRPVVWICKQHRQ